MLEALIAILIYMAVDLPCQVGVPVSWYRWIDTEAATSSLIMTVEPQDNQDVWVYQEADGDLLAFFFADKLSSAGEKHGECAVLIKKR